MSDRALVAKSNIEWNQLHLSFIFTHVLRTGLSSDKVRRLTPLNPAAYLLHKVGGTLLNALPKETTSKFAGFYSTLSFSC